jgi:hypothetical protein
VIKLLWLVIRDIEDKGARTRAAAGNPEEALAQLNQQTPLGQSFLAAYRQIVTSAGMAMMPAALHLRVLSGSSGVLRYLGTEDLVQES